MSEITEPNDLHFATFSDTAPGAAELRARAATCALGTAETAIASLSIASGPECRFELQGTHARGTIASDTRGTTVWIFLVLAVAIVIALVLLRR
jgi:hypothetical protein